MSFFITWFYQPFFNLLIAFYVLLERIPNVPADMGLAVIFLTLVIRILMLPLSIASTRSRDERHKIEEAILEIKKSSTSPYLAKTKIKKIMGTNRRVVISEAINFVIQVAIFFILYRIFTTGIEGEDFDLIYPFMPEVNLPFNLIFLGKFDLSHPNWILNLTQSLTILAVEILSLIDTPYPVSRSEFVRYIIILPVASFFLFMFLPAGKKLFVIATLWFSFFFILSSVLTRWFSNMFEKIDRQSVKKIDEIVVAGEKSPEIE